MCFHTSVVVKREKEPLHVPEPSSSREPQPPKRSREPGTPPPSDVSELPNSLSPATTSILPSNPYIPPPPQRRRPLSREETKIEKDKRRFKEWLENFVKLPKYECDLYSFIFDLDEEGLDDVGIWDKMNKLL